MKKVISIFLTILVLFSNAGLSLGAHYCGGVLMESQLGIGEHTLDCGMANMDVTIACSANASGAEEVVKGHCCENDIIDFSADDVTISKAELVVNPIAFLVAYAIVLEPLLFQEEEHKFDTSLYDPPLLRQDVPVLFQSFLL